MAVVAPSNAYHFISTWRFEGTTCEEVSEILGAAEDLPRWWPSVYLEVTVLDPGDARGIGKRVELLTKGRLPYTLRWSFVVTGSRKPHGFSLEAAGDFVGSGVWTFEPEGGGVRVTYDWRIRAEKGLLKRLSWVAKPIFSWNHRWAMRMGETSLALELRRRHAATRG